MPATTSSKHNNMTCAALLVSSVIALGSSGAQSESFEQPQTTVASPTAVAQPPAKAPVRRDIVPITRVDPFYPRAAVTAGITAGKVVAHLVIDDAGNVSDVTIVSAEPPGYFDRVVVVALKQWKFRAEGTMYVGEVEVRFALK